MYLDRACPELAEGIIGLNGYKKAQEAQKD